MEARGLVGDGGEHKARRRDMAAKLLILYLMDISKYIGQGSIMRPYRFRAVDLHLVGRWVKGFATRANGIYGLLRNLIVDMLANLLELGDGAKQVPSLKLLVSSGAEQWNGATHFEEDGTPLHLVERLVAVPGSRQSAGEFRHCCFDQNCFLLEQATVGDDNGRRW